MMQRQHLLFLWPLAIACAAWFIYTLFGHTIIAQAYYGLSPYSALNHFFANKTINPLSSYIFVADKLIHSGLILSLLLSYLFIVTIAVCNKTLNIRTLTIKSTAEYAGYIFSVIVFCAGAVVIAWVLWSYNQYTPNLPIQDDYETSLEFLLQLDDAESLHERAKILLQRHSIHITLVSNLANVIDWKLLGVLNFRHLVFIGFVFLLGMTAMIQLQIRGRDRAIHAMTVALLCINCLWYAVAQPIAALQNFPTLALIAAALLLLAKPLADRFFTAQLCVAALLLTLATFSAGHGMFGFLAGAAVLLIRGKIKALAGWSIYSILVIVFFFHIFSTRGDYALAVGLKQDIRILVHYYLSFLGAIVKVIPVYGATFAPWFGALLLSACLFLLQQKYYRRNPGIAALILFMLVTAGVVTLGRCGGGSIYSGPLAPRYTINSCILLALVYIALIEIAGHRIKRFHASLLCVVALAFNIVALQLYLSSMAERHGRLIVGAHRFVVEGDASGLAIKKPQKAEMLLAESAQRRIYNMATAFAAEQHSGTVQKRLGYMYQHGQGVTQDYQKAYIWYYLAGINGHADAIYNGEQIAKHLTPTLLANAQNEIAMLQHSLQDRMK